MEQTKAAEGRVEVEVRWDTEYGSRSETLRFRGKLIDRYEEIYSVHKNVAQHRTGAMPTSENSGSTHYGE
jgi:hypothetical protein